MNKPWVYDVNNVSVVHDANVRLKHPPPQSKRYNADLTRRIRLSEHTTWDIEKGEIKVLGERHVAIDVQALCNFLNSLLGVQVAEVVMHSVEYRLGKAEAEKFMAKHPGATLNKLIERLVEADRLQGVGITKVSLSDNPEHSVFIEVVNPATRGAVGAAKSFIFSWWAGALSSQMGKELDVNGVAYDEQNNTARSKLIERRLKK